MAPLKVKVLVVPGTFKLILDDHLFGVWRRGNALHRKLNQRISNDL